MKTRSQLFFFAILLFLCSYNCYAQSYGLGFYSHEVVQDQRTGLDLSPKGTLCFENSFELGFDISFFPKREDYFGYIIRFVVNDKENIDLIYDKDIKEKNHLKIIVGDQFTNIAFNITPEKLFNSWNAVKIRFDYGQKKLIVSNGSYVGSAKIDIKKGDCFKILFGANEYKRFKISDNPPMKIRNISIYEAEKMKYHWPLNAYEGGTAGEDQNGSDGIVNKPLWIKKLHYEWQLQKKVVVNGAASVAFDPDAEMVYIIERDSLKTFSVGESSLSSVGYNNRLTLIRGNHSLYDTANGRLLNFYRDQKTVSVFDKTSRKWSKDYTLPAPITNYWQYNNFYSASDSSLYVLGGYGHFVFKNAILRYHFPTASWDSIAYKGDTYVPRYLAALGSVKKGAYIIGGYGSSTGRQMLNPRNLYDLLFYDVKSRQIKKVYDLNVSGEDFVFANSLVINENEKVFYGLVFPKHKYHSTLQLLIGSLTNPSYKVTGSKIPFEFHDINSFADLFYSRTSKKLIAVTTFRDSTDRTHISIYTLNAPPLMETGLFQAGSKGYLLWGTAIAVFILLIIVFFILRKRVARKNVRTVRLTPVLPVEVPAVEPVRTKVQTEESENKNSVFLFGDLQVFDDEGGEITKQFTPLIKELFLVILLYTIKWERGISSDKLKELLWFDKSADSARNNRSVNIAKLKVILEGIGGCQISKETGYWRINVNPDHTYIDYQHYISIIKDKKRLDRDKIIELAGIIKRGSFLSIVKYEWMDSFKSEISNEIINTYLHFAHSIEISEDPELLIELANYIFYFDSINEEAMTIKCKALVHLGQHSQSKITYENFCREYRLLYSDEFEKNFNEVLNSNYSDFN